jgi:hypothetical protein
VVCFCVGVTTTGADGSLEVGVEVDVVVEGALLEDGTEAGVASVFGETDGCEECGLLRRVDGAAIARSPGTTGIDTPEAEML